MYNRCAKNNNLDLKTQNLYSSNAFQSRKSRNNKYKQRCEVHLLSLFIHLVCGCSAIHFTLCLRFILLRFLCGTGKHTSNASFLCIFFGRRRCLTIRWSCFGPRDLKHFHCIYFYSNHHYREMYTYSASMLGL